VFVVGLFGLAAYSPNGYAMRAVLATTVVWILARFAFWIGYHRSAAMRGLGAPGMALSMIVLLYVAGRVGFEVGGFVGAVVPVAAFLAIEAILFRRHCRRRPPINRSGTLGSQDLNKPDRWQKPRPASGSSQSRCAAAPDIRSRAATALPEGCRHAPYIVRRPATPLRQVPSERTMKVKQ
jgi:hypothetical protein